MDAFAFELLHPGQPQAPRLKGTDTPGDDHGPGSKARAGGGRNVKLAIAQHAQFGDFLAQMKRGLERLGLLQQSIDQFLGAAQGQGGNVIDRLIGIQLRALTAGLAQGIDDVSADPEQSQLEDLKQSHGTRADDDRFNVLFRHVKPVSLSFGKSARIVTKCACRWVSTQPDSILTVLMYISGRGGEFEAHRAAYVLVFQLELLRAGRPLWIMHAQVTPHSEPRPDSHAKIARDSTRPIRALNRGLEVLTELNRLERAAINTLAAAVGLPRTTTYRILETLRLAGFVDRDAHDDCYRPTIMG